MRIAKPLMMFSLSVFLLAVSWSLLAGQFGSVRPAHAQIGDPFVAVAAMGETGWHIGITETGQTWSFLFEGNPTTTSSWSRLTYLGQLGGGAVPTTSESLGSVKGRYGGNQGQ